MEWRTLKELEGYIITDIEHTSQYEYKSSRGYARTVGECLVFTREDGVQVVMYHEQDCCEYVWLEDVDGEYEDLIGPLILEAEEAYKDASDPDRGCRATWTFYKLGTSKGSVSLRWCGESNGYYSESVGIILVDSNGKQVEKSK